MKHVIILHVVLALYLVDQKCLWTKECKKLNVNVK